jgi:sortase A
MQEATHPKGGARETPPRLLRSVLPRVPGVAELVLWIFSATALGTAAWMQLDAYLYQRAAESTLTVHDPATLLSELARAPAPAQPRRPIAPGTPIARLVIPRLGVSVVVAEGIDSSVLRRAIGRIPSSALPGESGNVALAGHRDTFLRPLADVRPGDLIILESPTARFAYRVVNIEIVESHDTSVLGDVDYPALTLVTCYPFRYVGPAPQRFVVQARQVDSVAELEAFAPAGTP